MNADIKQAKILCPGCEREVYAVAIEKNILKTVCGCQRLFALVDNVPKEIVL